VWNVVAYFIQKCTCNLHLILQFIPPIFFQQPTAHKEKHGPYGQLLLIPDHKINGDDNLCHLPYHSNQDIENIPADGMGLDIGPDSIKVFQAALADCQTVIWNGPMGVFEFDKFAAGTEAIAHTLAEIGKTGATTIIGGGDSVAAVEKVGLADQMSHISTGGGASLELLEGKVLPGIAALDEA
jgi:3-phosphoglycerate kinase